MKPEYALDAEVVFFVFYCYFVELDIVGLL